MAEKCYESIVQDPYELLGVPRDAAEADIKAAFRRLALRLHPDKNPDDPTAHERFTQLNQAYQILSDPEKRRTYDRVGPAAFERSGAVPPPTDFSNLEEILGDLFSAFTQRSRKPGSIKKQVRISFLDAAHGCERHLEYERMDHCKVCHGSGAARGAQLRTCGTCKGRGKVRYRQGGLPFVLERPCNDCRGTGTAPSQPCNACAGSGLAPRNCQVTVRVPAGVQPDSMRIVEGAGHRAEPRGKAGDLEISIQVEPHPLFERDGDDVRCEAKVPFVTAALGGKLTVSTIDGPTQVSIPAAAQPGTVIRLRGKGVNGRGDQLITLNVKVPTSLSPRAKQLITEIQQELGLKPEQPGFVGKLKALFG